MRDSAARVVIVRASASMSGSALVRLVAPSRTDARSRVDSDSRSTSVAGRGPCCGRTQRRSAVRPRTRGLDASWPPDPPSRIADVGIAPACPSAQRCASLPQRRAAAIAVARRRVVHRFAVLAGKQDAAASRTRCRSGRRRGSNACRRGRARGSSANHQTHWCGGTGPTGSDWRRRRRASSASQRTRGDRRASGGGSAE